METPDPAFQGTQGAAPVWRFLITPRWLGWHVLMVVACWGMLWLGDWQLHRAMAGNGLSWAYTFEWPLFAGFAVVFWAKTIRDEFRIRRGGVDPTEGAERGQRGAEPAGLGSAAAAGRQQPGRRRGRRGAGRVQRLPRPAEQTRSRAPTASATGSGNRDETDE